MKSLSVFLCALIMFCTSYTQDSGQHSAMKREYIQLSGTLFVDVQLSGIFKDSKTFVDAVPLREPSEISDDYNNLKSKADFDLLQFISANFKIPSEKPAEDSIKSSNNMREHIRNLWSRLVRHPDEAVEYSTLVPLKNPYIVPGGRFREVYYWDSYFTILGLLADNRSEEVEDMIRNFASLLEEYGMVPNGNRIYYLTRSQPPFFSLMVDMMCRYLDDFKWGAQFLNAMEIEYRFWMNGADALGSDTSNIERVVMTGESGVLNRYYDFDTIPREESFREDHSLGQQVDNTRRAEFFRNIRAGAESGWDFSSRWFADTINLGSVKTTEILPVDLNCLLYFLEDRIAFFQRIRENYPRSELFRKKASLRAKLINRLFWDNEQGYYFDYNWKEGKRTGIYALSGVYPLFFKIADKSRAEKVRNKLKESFLSPGGLPSTLYSTGQQWDSPNGWAPLQWMTIKGLREYGYNELANEIKWRWLKLNIAVFERTGKMFEKYNVQDLSLYAGGGEYPLQDGFGWTNGVAAALLENFDLKYLYKKR